MPTTIGPLGSWRTFPRGRTVLGVAHNVTAATRLFDVLDLIGEDPRIEVVFTDPGSSAFADGTADFLASRGVRQVPWSSATTTTFDLAVAASHGHTLHELTSPLLIIPHGMGYNKYLPKPETGNRKPETGNRKPVFGLSDEWLLHDGRVIATVLALSHEEQLRRLTRDSPVAARHARVLGDLAFDQLSASMVRRAAYRRALGVADGELLVLVTSTWGPDSLLGSRPTLLTDLGTQLAVDDFRVAAALHPNIVWGHSPWQVRRWLAACTRAGVTVPDDVDNWRATLVAADVVVGDHGSVSFYAAALGIPVLLATAPRHTVAPDSAIGQFLRHAPRLAKDIGLAEQLRTAVARHDPAGLADITALATSLPGEASAAFRTQLYHLLDLPEPTGAAEIRLLPRPRRKLRRSASHVVHVAMTGPARARLARYPAERLRTEPTPGVLVVGPAEDSRRWHELADVIVGGPAEGTPERLLTALSAWPAAVLATAPTAEGGWLLGDRHGIVLDIDTAADLFAPVALHALAAGRDLADLVGRWAVVTGDTTTDITVTVH